MCSNPRNGRFLLGHLPTGSILCFDREVVRGCGRTAAHSNMASTEIARQAVSSWFDPKKIVKNEGNSKKKKKKC